MFSPNGKLSEKYIADFEREHQISLPDDYREFLQRTNGGTLQDAVLKPERPGDLLIDCLFGINDKDELSLNFWNNEFEGEIPENSVIVGSDAGGGFLLICMEEGLEGVYYYDHSYLFPTSSDSENTYLISQSFSELLTKLSV